MPRPSSPGAGGTTPPNRYSLERLSEVFGAVCDLPEAERAASLAERCGGDAELRRQVEELLRWDRDPLTRLEGPPAGEWATWLPGHAEPPARIGEYEVLSLLGAGGMGVVYEALQRSPRRKVALKLIRSTFLAEHARRFEDEAAVLGWLNHPGIATVYEAGTAEVDGMPCPYLAMELVEGLPLDRYARERALDVEERIELVARVADAVHHAHQKGVIHRDLKPGNVLVDTSGRPRVVDFGVARITDSDVTPTTRHTSAGEILGTLPYMSPEQVQGDLSELDTRTDVYALGVVLYELLSGVRPFDVTTRRMAEAVQAVVTEDPTPLGRLDPRLRGDVETLVAKAMEKEKERRYDSAADLAADLRRFLANEPIRARPASRAYQLRKFTRRNPFLVAGVASTFVALVAGLIGTLTFAFRAGEAAEDARNAEQEARAAQRRSEREAEKAVAVQELFVDTLMSSMPYRSGNPDLTVREAVRGASRILEEEGLDDPEIEIALRRTLGRIAYALRDYGEAEGQDRRALQIAEEIAAPAATTALIRLDLAGSLMELFEYDEAEEILGALAEDDELAASVDSPIVWMAVSNLGWLNLQKGNLEQAVEYTELAVRHLEGNPAARPYDLMAAYLRVSHVRMFRGHDRPRELETARRAHEIFEQLGGFQAVENSNPVMQLGNALDDNGRGEEAVEVYRGLLDELIELRLADPDAVAMTRMNLGCALLKLERFDEALDELLQAYDGLNPFRNNFSGNVCLIQRNVLDAYRRMGLPEEGVEWSAELMDLPGDDWNAWPCHITRGWLLELLGRHEEALSEFLPSYDRMLAQYPGGNVLLTEAGASLVRTLDALGHERADHYRAIVAQQPTQSEK